MDIFYALADPRRRKIMELLAISGALSATEIYKKFDVTAQAISQHLTILKEAKLVIMEKHAQKHIYQINPDSMLELEEWTRKMTEHWNQRFDALDKILEDEKRKNHIKKGSMYGKR
ncbi:MAG: metalloregulator ArsR/SmtB family transcription factor [Candidatus Micrarchaeaceae archaeon]|jgi:DNA-binding transcriptional ArsR family regulator